MLHSGDNCLTGIRQPTSGVTPSGHGQGFVAYPAALIAFYQVMTMKSLPAQAAFVTPNPTAGLPDPSPEVLPVEHDPSRTEKVCVLCTQGFLKFDRDRTGGCKQPRELRVTDVGTFLNHLAAVICRQTFHATVVLHGPCCKSSRSRWDVGSHRVEGDFLHTGGLVTKVVSMDSYQVTIDAECRTGPLTGLVEPGETYEVRRVSSGELVFTKVEPGLEPLEVRMVLGEDGMMFLTNGRTITQEMVERALGDFQ